MSELKDSGLEQLSEILNDGYKAGKTVSKRKEEECFECDHIKVTTKAELEEKYDLVPLTKNIQHLQKNSEKTFCGLPVDEEQAILYNKATWNNKPVKTIRWDSIKKAYSEESNICKKCFSSFETRNSGYRKIISFVKRRIYGYDDLIRVTTNDNSLIFYDWNPELIFTEEPKLIKDETGEYRPSKSQKNYETREEI